MEQRKKKSSHLQPYWGEFLCKHHRLLTSLLCLPCKSLSPALPASIISTFSLSSCIFSLKHNLQTLSLCVLLKLCSYLLTGAP